MNTRENDLKTALRCMIALNKSIIESEFSGTMTYATLMKDVKVAEDVLNNE